MRNWLQEKRQELNLSQDEIANEVGIKRPYYTMIENGVRTPSVRVAKKIASIIGCKWTYFFDEQRNGLTHMKDQGEDDLGGTLNDNQRKASNS